MDLKTQQSLKLSLRQQGWQALSLQALGPDSWRVCGLYRGRARRITLVAFADGSWRLLEQAQVRRLGSAQQTAMAGVSERPELPDHLAPMEGVIRQLLVEPGSQIEAGQALYVLEAMKMQLQVCASAAAKVEAIFVEAGQRVIQGQPVFKLLN